MAVQSRPQYTTLTNLANDIADILNTYRSNVLASIADNVDKCGDVFIEEVKKVSPPDDGPGIGGHYRDMWAKKKLRRQKFSVIVGNEKKVKRHQADKEPAIPLINILEFSKRVGKNGGQYAKPHVGTALNNSKDQIITIIADGISKESK